MQISILNAGSVPYILDRYNGTQHVFSQCIFWRDLIMLDSDVSFVWAQMFSFVP